MICSDSYIKLEFLMHNIEEGSRAWGAHEKWGIWIRFARIVTYEKAVKGDEKGRVTQIKGRYIYSIT